MQTLGLTGHECYTIDLPSFVSEIKPGQDIMLVPDDRKSFTCTLRFDTEVIEITQIMYFPPSNLPNGLLFIFPHGHS